MKRIFNIAVSLTKNDYAEFELRPPINMVSGDHGTNTLKFVVYDNGSPVDLTGNIAKITCKTPSGNRQQQDMTISTPREGKMEVVLDQRFFAEGGTYLAEVQLYDPSNLKVRATLPRFTYNVDASLLDERRVVANEQFSILQQMVDTVASAEERSIEALDTATRAMNIANQKGDKATEEANRAKNEADRAKTEADRAWAADFAKHVTLDTQIQHKLDFIKNKVVQDGFVGSFSHLDSSITSSKGFSYSGNIFYLECDVVFHSNAFNFIGGVTTNSKEAVIRIDNSTIFILDSRNRKVPIKENIVFRKVYRIKLLYNRLKSELTVSIDNESPKTMYDVTFTAKISYNNISIVFNHVIAYTRVLAQIESEHNFSVLNNPPAIKELHTTDSTGKLSVLDLASDEDHVEMSTGRTLREEYMGVLKTMGEEFTSADGSSIEVNNGIEARVINAEINGKTIKNIFPTNDNIVTQQSMFSSIISQCQNLIPSTKYVFGVFVTKFTEQSKLSFKLNTVNDVLSEYIEIPITKLGLNYIEKVVNSTSEKLGTVMIPSAEWGVEAKKFEFKNVYIADGVLYDNPRFGLNSTQAIISNNGQQYPIYEPTIQGKTRILNGKLVNLKPTDDLLPELGHVPSVSDTIDLLTGVLTIKTKIDRNIISGATWTKSAITNAQANCFQTQAPIDAKKDPGEENCFTNLFMGVKAGETLSTSTLRPYTCGIDSAGFLRFGVPKSIDTIQDMVNFIKNNPQELSYRLGTPVITQLTDEQLKSYNAHKKVISLGELGNVRNTLDILEDGSATLTQNMKEITLDGTKNYKWYINTFANDETKVYVRTDSLDSEILTGGVFNSDKFNYYDTMIFNDMDKDVIPKGNTICKAQNNVKLRFVLDIGALSDITVDALNSYFVKNPIVLSYQLATKTTTHIPKELVPAIRTHKTNTLEAGGAVKSSGFKATLPVNQITQIISELSAIKSVLNSPSNLLLSAKYVEDEFNKNNKLESEMMN